MSKSSIYESNWINLVFENRNKEYGAFQLRQENTKTSIMALLVSITICAVLFTIPKFLSAFSPTILATTEIPPRLTNPITPVAIVQQTKAKVQKKLPQAIQTPAPDVTVKSLAHPIIVKTQQATDEVPKNTNTIVNTKSSNEVTGIDGSNQTPAGGTGTGAESMNDTTKDYGNSVVLTNILDKNPSFPGGMDKFYLFISRNFESPYIEDEKSIRIYVSFIVEKDGTMSDIKVKNEPGYDLAKEAIRVMKSLKTKWNPGIINSKPVRTIYNLPIVVQMN